MTDEDRWLRWFHDRHAMPELARWACSLRFFRFCRAYGGHSNGGDLFLALLRFSGPSDLLALCAALGIALERVSPDHAERELRQTWMPDPSVSLKRVAQAHPAFLQPGHTQTADARAWVWIGHDRLEISVSDQADVWNVSEVAFEAAQRIEALLAPLAGRLVDPPRPSRHCLCPAFYPEVFAACN